MTDLTVATDTGTTRICALAECPEGYTPTRVTQRYCSPRCGRRGKYLGLLADPVKRAAKKAYDDRYRAENAVALRAQGAAWRAVNRERHADMRRSWYEANREHALRLTRDWSAANSERRAESERRRRAAKRTTTVQTITVAMLDAKSAYWGHRCWMCGAEPEAWDHVKPLAAGGPHMLSNLRPACRGCNLSKNGKWQGSTWTLSLIK